MKIKYLALVFPIAIVVLLIINNTSMIKKTSGNYTSLPSLPMPIAKEYALITSAGQNTDVYIVNDIANKLMIHNYFMPQAEAADLDGVNTVVFVVGYSALGEKLQDINREVEKKRIAELLQASDAENLSVILIYMGGRQQRDKETEELLRLIAAEANYLIGTKEANKDGFLSKLAKENRTPMTLINGVDDLSEPFASAFR